MSEKEPLPTNRDAELSQEMTDILYRDKTIFRFQGARFVITLTSEAKAAGLSSGTQEAELVSLEELLSRSDIVSLHARATPANRHLFSAELFGRMQPGAFFINTARESLVDEAALLAALERGHLGGAALDVMEAPPAGQRHPLLSQLSVFVTPHIGGATAETLSRGARLAAAGVADLLAGRVPANLVNPQVLQAQAQPAALRAGRGRS